MRICHCFTFVKDRVHCNSYLAYMCLYVWICVGSYISLFCYLLKEYTYKCLLLIYMYVLTVRIKVCLLSVYIHVNFVLICIPVSACFYYFVRYVHVYIHMYMYISSEVVSVCCTIDC